MDFLSTDFLSYDIFWLSRPFQDHKSIQNRSWILQKTTEFYSNYWHFLKEFDDTSDGSIDELKF